MRRLPLETEQNKLTHRDKHNPSSHEEQGRASEGQGRGGNEGAAATSEIARRMRPGETGLGPVTPWNGDPAWASLTSASADIASRQYVHQKALNAH